ncbi:XdhC family protein [Carboxydothermus hydrogenoformans]|uniref:Conserved domain protein n=1 Tax=Carboxydothermus hydrogenoformans (strain ATCC BAA-161 / DSM 6008 / Z-2901) TaxID=246194 RepID=Q3AAJ7_CARHZ|nr:XdhC family protein [Carboxydothermus hydrogenoformans]ABB15252.1 conserved domain protein [Carboxydothermus hydrogenoformans Z-2901]
MLFKVIAENLAKGKKCFLISRLFSEDKLLLAENGELLFATSDKALELKKYYTGGINEPVYLTKEQIFVEPIIPQRKLLVLGAGHVARPLVTFARELGFHITLYDDRPTFATRQNIPGADEYVCDSFERVLEHVKPAENLAVVVVTRGHQHDLTCVEQFLPYNLAYLGMIGSRTKVKAVFKALKEKGFTEEDLKKIYAPIGLDLGGKEPAEVALAIIAEIQAVYYHKTPKHRKLSEV